MYQFLLLRSKILIFFLLCIFLFGVIIQLSAVWFEGVYTKNGLFFCCSNFVDSVYHIALTNQIIKRIPPYQPEIYGVVVQNYHYWGNIISAELIRIFHLPLISTQYQYIMLFLSLFLGLSAVVFTEILQLGKTYNWRGSYFCLGFIYAQRN